MSCPSLYTFHLQYIGKILYDFETRATGKLFRIVSIQFVRSYTSTRHSCWEATCEPVVRDPATGNFRVPKDVQVTGSNVTLTHALQGYCLAEYTNGLEAEPSYLPWVQMYVDHFRNVIEPKFPSIMLYTPPLNNALPSPAKDSPSYKVQKPLSYFGQQHLHDVVVQFYPSFFTCFGRTHSWLWAKHVKSNGKIGQQHHDDVEILFHYLTLY